MFTTPTRRTLLRGAAASLLALPLASLSGRRASALARIESSLGSRKHSPSLATLRRYADACGKKLTIAIG